MVGRYLTGTASRPSNFPLFVEKVRDIVGLYLSPPERARRAVY